MVGVKSFQMPKHCRECKCYMEMRISYDEVVGCVFTRKTYNWGLTKRPQDCPLVDINDELVVNMEDDGK